jgi:hypothetical protein
MRKDMENTSAANDDVGIPGGELLRAPIHTVATPARTEL